MFMQASKQIQYKAILINHGKKLRKSLDSRGTSAALFNDLSQAFDYLPHGLLIVKSHNYGVKTDSEFVTLLPQTLKKKNLFK